MDFSSLLSYVLLGAAATGGVIAAFEVIRRWYFSTSFDVRFEGAARRVSVPPGSSRLLTVCVTNRSHRAVTCEGVGLGCPKVLRLEGLSIQGEPTRPWDVDQTDPEVPNLAFWSATIFGAFYLDHRKQLRLGLQFIVPTAPGNYAFDVVVKPENEPPAYHKLTLSVEAG